MEAVLDAAERVIAERGVAGAAMQEVAENAGVAVGTLYNYFHDRVGLLRALVTRHREVLADAIKGARVADAGFEANAVAFATAVFALFDSRRDFVKAALDSELWRALLGEAHVSAPPGTRVLHQLEARAVELVDEGVAQQRLCPDAGAEMLAVVLSGGVGGIVMQRAQRDENPPPRTDAERLVALFLDGARSRGHAHAGTNPENGASCEPWTGPRQS